MKSKLPPNGTIGFRTTAPDDLALYYLTQYTLAPVVVSQLPAQTYVISIDRDALNWSEDKPYLDFVVSTSGSDFKTFDFHNGIKVIKGDAQ
ncbi:MAG TPA: hypothetical protein VNI02_23755 [Blastocatellia bacterium]|nr:hypothetical protein [Blastocatellia bacterium]